MIALADNVAPIQGPLYGRLSIAHLLLTTTGSALAIWLEQPPGTAIDPVIVAVSVCFAPIYGIAIAAIVLAVVGVWVSHRPVASEPGHWLLLVAGSFFVGVTLFWRTIVWMDPKDGNPQEPTPLTIIVGMAGLFFAVFMVLAGGIAIVAALDATTHSPRWHVAIWLLAISVALPLSSCCCVVPLGASDAKTGLVVVGTFVTTMLTMLGTVISAAYRDSAEERQRDLWHWLGVVAVFGLAAHVVLFATVVAPKLGVR